ncbi:MAG: hypothetical protein V7K24_21645 [Nostoc sp.]
MSIVSVCSKIAVACTGVVSGRFSLKIIQPQLTDLDVRRRSPRFGKWHSYSCRTALLPPQTSHL